MTPGIYLLHKPEGPSSFAMVQDFRKSVQATPAGRAARVCHGGALDPFATGLLLMLVEPATRLFDYLHAIPKTYYATVRWGIETDNGDTHGNVTFTGDPSSLTPQILEDALPAFQGWHEQIPPATSNKRVDGERAYVKAHRGETFDLPPSRVYLHSARWLTHDLPRQSRLELIVRGGYYVRAFSRDLGRLLGCGAHLSQLQRQAIGPWEDPRPGRSIELTGRDILPWAAIRELSDEDVGNLRERRAIPIDQLIPPEWNVPPGFPDPEAPIRGFHLDKFRYLLTPKDGQLQSITDLKRGL
jgi:tRNA pseudouridine55 synthase